MKATCSGRCTCASRLTRAQLRAALTAAGLAAGDVNGVMEYIFLPMVDLPTAFRAVARYCGAAAPRVSSGGIRVLY